MNKDFIKHQKLINSLIPENPKCLNVGCGVDYRIGWVNLDAWENSEVHPDVLFDLTDVTLKGKKLPFKDNTFDYIFSAHTLEHIAGKQTELIIEFWRILKPNGILEIRVPHSSGVGALEGMEHVNQFCWGSFNLFCDINYFQHIPNSPFLQNRKKPLFEYISFKMRHQRTDDGRRWLIDKKGYYYYVAQLIDRLSDFSPHFCEKIWCYNVGGFQEMQTILKKIE